MGRTNRQSAPWARRALANTLPAKSLNGSSGQWHNAVLCDYVMRDIIPADRPRTYTIADLQRASLAESAARRENGSN